jgi:hypothetical protein
VMSRKSSFSLATRLTENVCQGAVAERVHVRFPRFQLLVLTFI